MSALASPTTQRVPGARDPLLWHSLLSPVAGARPMVRDLPDETVRVWEAARPVGSVVEIAARTQLPVSATVVLLQELMRAGVRDGAPVLRWLESTVTDPELLGGLGDLAPGGEPLDATWSSAAVVLTGHPAGAGRVLETLAGPATVMKTVMPGPHRPAPEDGGASNGVPANKPTAHRIETAGFVRLAHRAPNASTAVYVIKTPVPEPHRGPGLWVDAARGALGAVIAVETGAPHQVQPAVAACEESRLPYVVAVMDQGAAVDAARLRVDLDLPAAVPVVAVDTEDRSSCLAALGALGERARYLRPQGA